MPITNVHGLHAINFDGTVVGGIQNNTLNTGTEVRHETSSGEVYSRFGAIVAQNPGLAFTSVDLDAVLGQIGVTGLDIDSLGAGIIAYAEKRADGGTRAGAASHRSYTIVDGMGVLRQLTVDHQGDATISAELAATWDTSNDPIQIADGVTLPGGVTDENRFGLGPATIGSETIDHKKSLAIDFGAQVRIEGSESDVWPTHASIDSIQPVITVRGVDVEWLKSTVIPLVGKEGTQANTIIYLRKRKVDLSGIAIPGYEEDATAAHIKIQAAGYVTIDPGLDASANDPAECSLIMNCIYDGSNAPVKITTSSAIT